MEKVKVDHLDLCQTCQMREQQPLGQHLKWSSSRAEAVEVEVEVEVEL